MPVQPLLAPAGLYTNSNALAAVPQGALLRADNVEIGRDGIVDSLKGLEGHTVIFDQTPQAGTRSWAFYTAAAAAKRMFYWKGTLLAHRATGALSASSAASIGGSFRWVDYTGTFATPDTSGTGASMRFAQAGGTLFFTTSAGLQKLDSLTGTPTPAGVPKALDPTVILVAGTGTAVPTANGVAYRVVWCLRDATGRVLYGAPSGRGVYSNASGVTANLQVSTIAPPGITTSHFLQVYRSASFASGVEPSDELQLVYETATGFSAGSTVTVTDIAPDTQRGAALYSNPSQQGGLMTNEPPPLGREVCRWRNNLFILNTTTKRRRFLTLIGTGTGSLSVGDVLTLGGSTYTGILSSSAPGASDGTFQVWTSGTAASNIQLTARDLVRAINARSGNTTLTAFYASAVNEAPGKILLEERGIGNLTDASFALIASAHGSAFSPVLPTSGTTVFVPSERGNGRLYWSKDGQYEAFPVGNNVDLGDGAVDGLRLLPLRDSLIILKSDGAYRCTGRGASSFAFQELDVTAVLIAPDSAAVLSNQVFGLFDQGVCSLSDGSGLQVLSRPIENNILPLAALFPTQAPSSFAIANEQERIYELHVPASGVSTGMGEAWRYNLFTRAWTHRTLQCVSATVGASKAYYAYANGWTLRQKRTFTAKDYQAQSIPFVIDFTVGNLVAPQKSDSGPPELDMTAYVSAGDYVVQGTRVSRITAVSTTGLTVADTLAWTSSAAAEVVKVPLQESVLFAPATLGDPTCIKTIQDVIFFFEGALPATFTAVYDPPTGPELTASVDTSLSLLPGQVSAPPPAAAVQAQFLSVGFQHQVLYEPIHCLGAAVLMRANSERGFR